MVTLDDMANALNLKPQQIVKGFAAYGEVKGINSDGTYQVSLNGSTTTVKCARLTGAHVGDVVLVTVLNNGYAVATGCVGGDTDALEAKAAADGTAQYFWYKDGTGDEAGAHVTKVPRSEFEADPQGGNLLLRSNVIKLRQAGLTLMELATSGMKIYASENAEQVAEIGYGDVWTDSMLGEKGAYFTFGTRASGSIGRNSMSVGTDNLVIAKNSAAFGSLNKIYPTHTGSLMGNSECMALGLGLTLRGSRQFALGMWNDNNTDDAFEIGNGTSDDARSNAFAIGWNGEIRSTLETPTVSISATTGTLVSATARRFGQVVQLYMQVRKTSSTAAGANVFVGTLNTTALIPVIPARGASYFGTHSIVGALSAAGEIIIRNASPTAVTIGAGETAGITFTYLVA